MHLGPKRPTSLKVHLIIISSSQSLLVLNINIVTNIVLKNLGPVNVISLRWLLAWPVIFESQSRQPERRLL
jgi:hypothetical protein